MKKSMPVLLTVLMMLFCTVAMAQDIDLSAVCTNYSVSFEVSGANVDYFAATPDGDNGTLDIIVSGIEDTVTVTPTFTDTKAEVLGTNPEIITLDLGGGFAITEFEVVFKDIEMPAGRWTINAVDADYSEEGADGLIISTDLDELGVIYTRGTEASALSVVAEYTGTAEEPVTYQWYSNTIKSTEGATAILGATSESYTPSTAEIGTTYYFVTATCNNLTAVSKIAEITVEAPALPVEKNVIDISDRTLQSENGEYVKLTDLIIIGARVEKATENDLEVNILLDGNTPADAEISFEFGTELHLCEIAGHTGDVKLNGGAAAKSVTVTAKSLDTDSWEESVTYKLSFSLGTPSERKPERLEITKKPTKTNYIEGESFDPTGMEVTVYYDDASCEKTESFEYSPSGKLSADDTEITVTYKENEEDVGSVSATVAITVTKKQSGGGSVGGGGSYEENVPQYDSINVYITFINRGEIVVQDEEIEVYDENGDGKYCVGDAFLALHRTYYPDGEDGYKEISGNGLDGWVSKFWGKSEVTFTYAHNYRWAKSTKDAIDEEDIIAVVNGTDEMFYSDLYTWFEERSYSTRVGEEVSFRVNGLNLMASNATHDALHAPVGATVTVYDQNGDEVTDMSTTVSKGGIFTLKFAENGTYTVEISGNAKWGSYDDAPVAPSTCTVNVKGGEDSIGGGGEAQDKNPSQTSAKEADLSSSINIEIRSDDLTDENGTLSAAATLEEDGSIVIDVFADDKRTDEINGGLKIAIPCENEDDVMAIVNKDGSRTILAKHIIKDGKHHAIIPGSVTIRLLDNRKEFTDSKGHWGEESISFVAERELYQGVGDGRFDTEGIMTRAMMVAVLYRLDGSTETKYTHNFDDVSDEQWYADAVAWASANDIVKGVEGNLFTPDAEVTREQAAAILYRYAQYIDMPTHQKADLEQFKDCNKISDWAKEANSWAVGAGIIGGKTDNILDSCANATRTEVAAIIERFVTLMLE